MIKSKTCQAIKAKIIAPAIVIIGLLYVLPFNCQAAIGNSVGGIAINFIESNGSTVTQRNKLNFIGSGVNCVDNSGNIRTDCTFSGSGGGSSSQISSFGTLYTSSSNVSQAGITSTPILLNIFQGSGDSNLTAANLATSQIQVSTSAAYHIWANIISTGTGNFNQYFKIYVNGFPTTFSCQDTPSARCEMGGVKNLASGDIIQVYTSVNTGSQSIMVVDAQLEVFAVGSYTPSVITDAFLFGDGSNFLFGDGSKFLFGH